MEALRGRLGPGMRVGERTRVAVYRRRVGASLERVWENVLDWEHLPWLHAGSFRSIHCRHAGDWGWRAQVWLEPRGDHADPTKRRSARTVGRCMDPGWGQQNGRRLLRWEGYSRSRFCSVQCRNAAMRKPKPPRPPRKTKRIVPDRQCDWCGVTYAPNIYRPLA